MQSMPITPEAVTLPALREQAAPLFDAAITQALANPSTDAPPALEQLHELARQYFETRQCRCMADAFACIVPRSDTLTIRAWSEQCIQVRGFALRVKAKAFSIAHYCVHLEVMSEDRSPLPFTPTGYQSLFVPFAALVHTTLAEYVRDLFPADPIQVDLF